MIRVESSKVVKCKNKVDARPRELRNYVNANQEEPFQEWLDGLDSKTRNIIEAMPKRTSSHQERLLRRLSLPEEAANYLNAAMDDSAEVFLEALRDVAQAHQMTIVASQSGIKRETIYKATRKTGNPTLETLNSVLRVCGLQIKVTARKKRSSGVGSRRRA